MRILTTYPIPESPRWQEQTDLLQHVATAGLLGSFGWFRDIRQSLQMLKLRKQYDVVITGAGRMDCLFALLQTFLPGPRIPHIMTCCLWKRERNKFLGWLKRTLLRLAGRSIDKFVVWSTEELDNYSEFLGIERERFVFQPHHATLESFDLKPTRGNYVFAGGDSVRDYVTLLKAFDGIDIPLVIAAKNPKWQKAAAGMSHVKVDAVSPEEFVDLMSGCRLVVVPIEQGTMRGAGQQTYLNAMQLRKPVVVSQSPGVLDHLDQGKTAWIVPPGNATALRDAVEYAWHEGQDVLEAIDAAERAVAENFTLAHFVDRNLELAYRLAVGKGDRADAVRKVATSPSTANSV